MNIGNVIRELRKEKGLSQSELAKKAQITQAAMSGIENGNTPNKSNLGKLCKALGVSEGLLYAMAIEKTDVPVSKRNLYDALYPVIKDLVIQIAKA